MNEKIYKTVGSTGVSNLIVGICILAAGIASGIVLIINGSRLLKSRKKILL